MCIINKLYLSDDGIPYFVPFQKKLLESLDNKSILVLAFLYRFRAVWGNAIWLSINQLISWCGYSNGNKTRNMEIFKGILQSFVKLGWIELADDIIDSDIKDNAEVFDNGITDIPESLTLKNLKINEQFQLIVNHNDIPVFDMSTNVKGGFVKFTFSETDQIRLADTKLDIGDLACAYLSTKQYIAEDSADDNKSVIPNDYKCKIAHPKLEILMDVTGIKSTDTMSKYMDELVSIGLLFSVKCGTINKMKNGGYIKFDTPTCYALEERFLEQAEDVLKEYYGVDTIHPYNEDKDKPPINYNPTRPDKHKNKNDNITDASIDNNFSLQASVPVKKDIVSSVPVATIDKDISINATKDNKINQNPYSDEYNPPDGIEDKLPFDTSGMNSEIVPYKTRQRDISQMDAKEFFAYAGLIDDQVDEDIWDDLIDVESINTDSDEGDEIPIGYKIICGLYVKPMVDGSFKDKSGGYWCLDDGELVPFS